MKWQTKPTWTDKLLQATAFWVGYKSQLYHYPLTEGAIVGEAAALLSNGLDKGYRLECEIMYKELNAPVLGQARADLAIKQGDHLDTIIEVKRATASRKKIDEDFKRLATVHRSNPSSRCFLLLVSQGLRPVNYVTDEGKAVTGVINTKDYTAKVRRACKAASSFRGTESAHYSCLIEVVSR